MNLAKLFTLEPASDVSISEYAKWIPKPWPWSMWVSGLNAESYTFTRKRAGRYSWQFHWGFSVCGLLLSSCWEDRRCWQRVGVPSRAPLPLRVTSRRFVSLRVASRRLPSLGVASRRLASPRVVSSQERTVFSAEDLELVQLGLRFSRRW